MSVVPFDRRARGRLLVVEAPRSAPPFPVDAVVEEDDTFHVLSGEPTLEPVEKHPIRVLADAHAVQPTAPGAVVVRPGSPLRLLAVVHALDEDPTCRRVWIDLAYRNLLREIDGRKLEAVGLPLLGTVHGRFDHNRSRTLLEEAIRELRPASLARIWIVNLPR